MTDSPFSVTIITQKQLKLTMSHSNRIHVHFFLVIAEVTLFILAIVSAYLGQVNHWPQFIGASIAATIIFIIVKILEAVPAAREFFVREDFASKIATSAGRYGVRDYFNMQSSIDQTRRNESTQAEISTANTLSLCANSGASFLDPALYRHWPFVERRLQVGVGFRVVLLDPYSREKAFRNQMNAGGEQFDSKVNIANLIKLSNAFPSLEIRFAKHGMHATVFITENSLFFDPYQLGVVGDRIENRSFSLKIESETPSEGIGLYRLFKSHFDTLWRSSIALSDWLAEHQANLQPGLPTLRTMR